MWIVATAVQAPDIVVRHVGDQLEELGIFTEEVLAHVRAVVRLERLIFAVDAPFHALQQQAFRISREQRIPVRPPDHLDHVPAGAAEVAFQLLNDLAIAAHGAVEALEIAVDDENQVVELLASGE